MTMKPNVDQPVGQLRFSRVAGGTVEVGVAKKRWTMLFVYRGKHCPRCKRFLEQTQRDA